ncbi:hypothetical protein B1T50_04845 [Mycobacterium kansasii]|nr:hypothetical protein B1T50_04845 [Mycobacterium kansasii]
MRMPKTPPLSTAAAESLTGIPKRTIIAAINRGDLKAHKMNGLTGAFLIEQRDLDRWVAKREAKSA